MFVRRVGIMGNILSHAAKTRAKTRENARVLALRTFSSERFSSCGVRVRVDSQSLHSLSRKPTERQVFSDSELGRILI